MENRYFFDKRIVKKNLIKYGLIFLCLFPILVLVNYFLNKVVGYWTTIIIDVILALLAIFIYNKIEAKIKHSKEEDIVAKKVKEIKQKRNQNEEK